MRATEMGYGARWAATLVDPHDVDAGSKLVHEHWESAAGPTLAARALSAARAMLTKSPPDRSGRNLGHIPNMLLLAGAPSSSEISTRSLRLIVAVHILGEVEMAASEASKGSLDLLFRDPERYAHVVRAASHEAEETLLAAIRTESPMRALGEALAASLGDDLARLAPDRTAPSPRLG